jgi:hypothetical protein
MSLRFYHEHSIAIDPIGQFLPDEQFLFFIKKLGCSYIKITGHGGLHFVYVLATLAAAATGLKYDLG